MATTNIKKSLWILPVILVGTILCTSGAYAAQAQYNFSSNCNDYYGKYNLTANSMTYSNKYAPSNGPTSGNFNQTTGSNSCIGATPVTLGVLKGSAFTIMGWVYFNNETPSGNKGTMWSTNMGSISASMTHLSSQARTIKFMTYDGITNPNLQYTFGSGNMTNRWIQIAWLRNSSGHYMFVNGTLVNSSTTYAPSGGTANNSNSFGITYGASDAFDTGLLDNWYITDTALTAAQINASYAGNASITATSSNFTLTASDLNTGTTITAFNATIQYGNGTTTFYDTTTGQINTTTPTNSTFLANVTVSAPFFMSATYQNLNLTTALIANLTEVMKINVYDEYDNTAIGTYNISITYNGSNYTYTTTTYQINTTLPRDNTTLQNITINANNYFTKTYTNTNTSNNFTGTIYQAQLTFGRTDVNGINITQAFTVNETAQNRIGNGTSTTQPVLYLKAGTYTIRQNSTSYYNTSQSFTVAALENSSRNFTSVPNAYITWRGNTSLTTYIPICTWNSTTLVSVNTNYYSLYNPGLVLSCIAASGYPAQNYTANWTPTAGPVNISFNTSEYYLQLNFTTNVSGNITWTQPNDAGQCCQIGNITNDSGYNQGTFQYIRARTQFASQDLVRITFNQQSNQTIAQYYEFVNQRDTILTDYIGILPQLNTYMWFDVFNYGNDVLFNATVRIMYYPNNTTTSGYVVAQRVTQPAIGTGSPGALIYLDKTKNYIVTVTKAGYTCGTQSVYAADYQVGGEVDIKCTVTPSSTTNGIYVYGPTTHQNQSTILVGLSSTAYTSVWWNTTYNPTLNYLSISNGGATIPVLAGTNYAYNTNFTVQIYTANSTSSYINIANWTVNWNNYTQTTNSALDHIDENDSTTGIIVWVAIIILSSILGALFKTQGDLEAGYYIFCIGTIIAGIVYYPLLWVTAITIVGAAISLVQGTTND